MFSCFNSMDTKTHTDFVLAATKTTASELESGMLHTVEVIQLLYYYCSEVTTRNALSRHRQALYN